MSLRFLLDANVLSEPLRPAPRARVLEKLQRFQAAIATASVVWHEMVFGAQRLPEKRRRVIASYLADVVASGVAVLPYDQEAASWHAEERARLVAEGRTPSFTDGQIAAVARVNDLTVVTRNTAHFNVFRSLEVVDWFAV